MRNSLNDHFVDGNTMAHMSDQDRENTASHEDQYFCEDCDCLLTSETGHFDVRGGGAICEDCFEKECDA
jgi:hypothetical protein